jgi:GT2 family glycosyltransferase
MKRTGSGVIASVIVVGFNGKRYLRDCLNSVLDQDMPAERYEVIYVDNNSKDGSPEYVEDTFPAVRVIRFNRNHGYYGAFNRASETVAQGKYLIALPQDTIVHKRWLSELVRVAEEESDTWICLVNSVNPGAPDFEEKERLGWVKWVYLMATTKLGQVAPTRWPFSEEIVPVLAYSGVSALMKREIRDLTGYFFDPSVSHFLGDVELGLRVNALGYKVVLVPTAIVYHIEDSKKWLNIRLLFRALEGARDNFVVYYRNMFGLEFILLLPLLFLGIPLKAFGLRTGWLQRCVLFLIAVPLCPVAFTLALLSFPRHAPKRREILAKRQSSRFWLLEAVLGAERK